MWGRGLSAPPLSHKQLYVSDIDGMAGRRVSRNVQGSKRLPAGWDWVPLVLSATCSPRFQRI